MGLLRIVARWLVDRLGLDKVARVVLRHPVPPGSTSRRKGWMYVFGAAVLVAFLLQVVTGIALATKYVPAPAFAHQSLRFITDEVWMGDLLRGMHFFGASAMVVLVVVHMARVFLTGSYKFPRELNWLSGVALLLLTLAMAFTGQLLRWDANGVWGVVVAAHYVGRVPGIGEALKEFILAGDTVGGATLSRFYAFHVILMPLLILAIIGLHVFLVFHHGISEPPETGRPVDRKRYRDWYRALLDRHGRPYFPDAAWREALTGALLVGVVLGFALVFGPRGPGAPPDPTLIPAEPKPDWYLLWYYALLSIKPPRVETFVMVYLPILMVAGLVLLPFVRGGGERSLRRRPWAVLSVAFFATAFGVLTELGRRSPWVMDFETRPPTPEEVGVGAGPIWQGAQLFHDRGCQACHAVDGRGGRYGPPLTRVMRRLPPEIVTTRIVQGYGDMPGYRGQLSQDELSALLEYLRSLEDR